MKTLYFISGTMGVGKTTVSKILASKLDRCVFLDGDWCCSSYPFIFNDEIKDIIMDNICHLLYSFIHAKSFDNIVFCWVMHKQEIIDEIIRRINPPNDLRIKVFTLMASPDIITKRITSDINNHLRDNDCLNRSLTRIPMYQILDSIKIDTDNLSSVEIALKIINNE